MPCHQAAHVSWGTPLLHKGDEKNSWGGLLKKEIKVNCFFFSARVEEGMYVTGLGHNRLFSLKLCPEVPSLKKFFFRREIRGLQLALQKGVHPLPWLRNVGRT